ncbi:AAA family ATPase [Candidatus Babela massiliensis]|uniref:Ulp1-like desumoylating protease fused to AAA ATPase n=1 Tax=Candidatus Babela massiliensis TaxID=673862 RepID=V6DIK9_9BACT|nr:AAA family ATPase [Candidatus Babela massiliensis]CDK30763.1 Ulp1-like desumoylating protease fused to AAA ATPase [Candidatus Babela massiliensis]
MHINKYKLTLPNLFLMLSFGLNAMELSKVKPANITQIDVTSQNPQSGTCGYHALYNGIIIAKSLKKSSDLKFFNKENFNKRLFKDLKRIWKEQIVKQRVKFLLKQLIVDYLFKNIILDKEIVSQKPDSGGFYELNLSHEYVKLIPVEQIENCTYSEEERKAICDIIVEVADNIINKDFYYYDETDICRFYENSYGIFKVFKEIMLNKTIKGIPFYQNNRFYTKIRRFFYIDCHVKKDNIINCEPLDSADTERCPLSNYKIDWSDISKKGQALESSKPGHWVSSKEIEYLINILLDKKRSSSSFLPENTKIFCLEGDIQDLFNLEDNLKQTALEFKDNDYEGTAIFILYYPQHWVTCVVDKKKNEHPRFIFADSLNIDRTKSDQAFELIGELSDFNFAQNKFIPIDILVEDEYLARIENIIETLSSNQNSKDIWLYGPSNTGKYSLAHSISKLSKWQLNCISALNPAELNTTSNKIKGKNKEEIVELYNKAINQLIDTLAKQNNPTVLFIHQMDKIKDAFKKQVFKLFVRKLQEYKNNNLLFTIFSSQVDPKELTQYYDFDNLVNYISMTLPDNTRRLQILDYYIKNLLYKTIFIKKNKNNKTFSLNEQYVRELHKKLLADETKGFTGYDIEDMILQVSITIRKDIKNKGEDSVFYKLLNYFDLKYIFSNFIDLKDKPRSSLGKIFSLCAGGLGLSYCKNSQERSLVTMATFLSLAVIEKFSYPKELKNPNEYEQRLHTYCSNQKKIIAERKKAIKNDNNTNKLLNKILNGKKLDKSKNESNNIIENITEKNNKENIQISGHKQIGLIFWEGFIEALKNKTQPTIEQMIDFLVNLAKRKISNSEEAQ